MRVQKYRCRRKYFSSLGMLQSISPLLGFFPGCILFETPIIGLQGRESKRLIRMSHLLILRAGHEMTNSI